MPLEPLHKPRERHKNKTNRCEIDSGGGGGRAGGGVLGEEVDLSRGLSEWPPQTVGSGFQHWGKCALVQFEQLSLCIQAAEEGGGGAR